MPKDASSPPKPSKAEEEAWAKARAERVAWGTARALDFQNATQGATDRSDKPGCRAKYGERA